MDLKISNSNKTYECKYCHKQFSREKTLSSHICIIKSRIMQKDEKRIRLGFYAYTRFFEITMKTIPRNYEEFCRSQYYNIFVKFGSFLSNVKPLYTDKFIDYIVTSGIKVDHWCDEKHYENYILNLIKKEAVEVALERSINTMVEWATETNENWNEYFIKVSNNKAVWHIKDGKISPWLILNCKSGKQLLSQLTDEQLSMIYNILDPTHWAIRFKRYPKDVELINTIVKQAGL